MLQALRSRDPVAVDPSSWLAWDAEKLTALRAEYPAAAFPDVHAKLAEAQAAGSVAAHQAIDALWSDTWRRKTYAQRFGLMFEGFRRQPSWWVAAFAVLFVAELFACYAFDVAQSWGNPPTPAAWLLLVTTVGCLVLLLRRGLRRNALSARALGPAWLVIFVPSGFVVFRYAVNACLNWNTRNTIANGPMWLLLWPFAHPLYGLPLSLSVTTFLLIYDRKLRFVLGQVFKEGRTFLLQKPTKPILVIPFSSNGERIRVRLEAMWCSVTFAFFTICLLVYGLAELAIAGGGVSSLVFVGFFFWGGGMIFIPGVCVVALYRAWAATGVVEGASGPTGVAWTNSGDGSGWRQVVRGAPPVPPASKAPPAPAGEHGTSKELNPSDLEGFS